METEIKIEMLFVCMLTLVTYRIDVTGMKLIDMANLRLDMHEEKWIYRGIEFYQKLNGKYYLLDKHYERICIISVN